MKKYCLSIVAGLFLILPFLSTAQRIEVTPTIGYQFGGKINFFEGSFKIEDNMNYGVTLGIDARQAMIEIYWTKMDTRGKWNPYNITLNPRTFDMNVQYFQVGGMREQSIGEGTVIGFGGITLGAVYFNSVETDIEDVWRFAMTVGGGAKIILSDRIGIRLQGRLLMPIYGGGGGFYCGIGTGGSGCGASVGATAWLLQGDLTAGLIINLGK